MNETAFVVSVDVVQRCYSMWVLESPLINYSDNKNLFFPLLLLTLQR
ncbi:hypothetical protein AC87_4783 [Escherichia coli 3-105-05_S4_C1]|nr:hypothetical protein AC87_4783 [Escherichia coli 3-105-05_S4_C1]